jgi:AAA domain
MALLICSNYQPERRRSSYTPVSVSKPLRRTRHLNASPSTVVTNDDSGVPTTNSKKKRSVSLTTAQMGGKKKRQNSTAQHSTPPEVEYHVTEAAALIDEPSANTPLVAAATTRHFAPNNTVQDTTMPFASLKQPPLPSFQGCDADRLRATGAALSLSNRFDSPTFQSDQPSSRFANNLNAVYNHLVQSVSNRTHEISSANSSESNAMYVCGVPGIGKTSGVHWCCDQFLRATKDTVGTNYAVCKLNASSLITAKDPFDTAVKQVRLAMGMKIASFAGIRRRITRGAKTQALAKSYLVMVVDEIDALTTQSKLKEVFTTFTELANDHLCQFTLIGISNSMSDEKFRLMQSGGNVRLATFFSTGLSLTSLSVWKCRHLQRLQ